MNLLFGTILLGVLVLMFIKVKTKGIEDAENGVENGYVEDAVLELVGIGKDFFFATEEDEVEDDKFEDIVEQPEYLLNISIKLDSDENVVSRKEVKNHNFVKTEDENVVTLQEDVDGFIDEEDITLNATSFMAENNGNVTLYQDILTVDGYDLDELTKEMIADYQLLKEDK